MPVFLIYKMDLAGLAPDVDIRLRAVSLPVCMYRVGPFQGYMYIFAPKYFYAVEYGMYSQKSWGEKYRDNPFEEIIDHTYIQLSITGGSFWGEFKAAAFIGKIVGRSKVETLKIHGFPVHDYGSFLKTDAE